MLSVKNLLYLHFTTYTVIYTNYILFVYLLRYCSIIIEKKIRYEYFLFFTTLTIAFNTKYIIKYTTKLNKHCHDFCLDRIQNSSLAFRLRIHSKTIFIIIRRMECFYNKAASSIPKITSHVVGMSPDR